MDVEPNRDESSTVNVEKNDDKRSVVENTCSDERFAIVENIYGDEPSAVCSDEPPATIGPTSSAVAKTPMTGTERKRLSRQRDREDPERKKRKLDTLYMFGEVEVSVIVDDEGKPWFKGVDLARALEMEAPNNAIYQTIDKKYCKSYETLISRATLYRGIPHIHPKTTFVNQIGMNLFVVKSHKPKAGVFTEWVCSEVLPSIQKYNKYEIDPENNPYRELNEFLKSRIEELEKQKDSLETKNFRLENNLCESSDRLFRCNEQILTMRASCVPTLKNELKKEYFVLYRKFKPGSLETQSHFMPYYACRVQLHSLEDRRKELASDYPDLDELLKLEVPNSVAFFNLVREKMPEYVVCGKGMSFRINGITEEQMLTMIENLYRTQHGKIK